ncbi:MAG TPA: PQQ-binding-like beta-propeller repeat protein [Actinomycetota bacterium]|nr:PQQ-binding-like beta-propeller repeat protein [Actinomycetota bacterium]
MGAVFGHASRAYRQHRRLTIRIGGALIAMAAGLVVAGGAIRLLDDASREPPRTSPSSVATFDWSASLAAPVTGLAIEENRLYVASDAITVFPVSCVADEGRCTPRWRNETAGATGPWSAPLVTDGRVFTGSADGRLLAHPDTCSAEGCAPDWIGEAGEGPVSQPVANFDFVYVTSDALYAFPVGCATEGRECPPAWSAQVPGRPSSGPVALGDGLVVVSSSGRRSGLSAFPAVCGAECEPAWTARFEGRATAAAVGDGLAYTGARGRLLAFSTSCSGRCEPQWRAQFATAPTSSSAASPPPPGPAGAPVVAGDRVLFADAEGRLWVFAASCDDARCDPIASYQVSSSPLLAPFVDGDTAVVTSASGTVDLVDLACDPLASVDACPPVRVTTLGAESLTPSLMTPDAVIASGSDGSLEVVAR